MSLKLPANFKSDLQDRDTNLFPLVVIGNYDYDAIDLPSMVYPLSPFYALSTNSFYSPPFLHTPFNSPHGEVGAFHAKPLLLNIPSLKESIDIEKRNYKISSVNLDISNYLYEGERFSELVGDSSLINMECRIWWISPSSKPNYNSFTDHNTGYQALGIADQNWAVGEHIPHSYFQVFFGTIRRYTHDDEKVRLVVEDRSQATLHKDLPTAELGFGDDVPSKYQGVKIPMVYGSVDRSPCVIGRNALSEDLSDGSYEIWGDSTASSTNINATYDDDTGDLTNDPLYIYRNGEYLNVLRNIQEQTENWGDISIEAKQYYIENLNKIIIATYNDGVNINLISLDQCQVRLIKSPSSVFLESEGTAVQTGLSQEIGVYAGGVLTNVSNLLTGAGTTTGTGNLYATDTSGLEFSIYNPLFAFSFNITDNDIVGNVNSYLNLKADIIFDYGNYADNINTFPAMVGSAFISRNNNIVMPKYFWSEDEIPEDGVLYSYNYSNVTREHFLYQKTISGVSAISHPIQIFDPSLTVATYPAYFNFTVNIQELAVECIFEVDKLFQSDFYANVIGRTYTDELYGLGSGAAEIVINTPGEIIRDILMRGLGQPFFNIEAEQTAVVSFGQYAFTVDKKINSKKLIEGIASASPYIPRFDNMGNFKFDVIPMGSVTAEHTIKEADVINYSFSRTKIEDVYTKIEFKYNWDYAREDFNDSVTVDVLDTVLGVNEDEELVYKFSYYGFTDPVDDDNSDDKIHPDSTLVIDDNRGQYIREYDTAINFAYWYLMWSCNQHLKMKIKLPLKYMNLEIGDFVNFDEILGGVKPYGIDYIADNAYVNSQKVFKNFLITNTNKTLEWVEIECIQMHSLDSEAEFDCAGVVDGDAYIDNCYQCVTAEIDYGECACGDIPAGDCDCAGNVLDECNVCGGDGVADDDCCPGLPMDQCEVCGGDNACFGCIYPDAENYDPDATIDDESCEFLNEGESCRPYLESVTIQDTANMVYNQQEDMEDCNPLFQAEPGTNIDLPIDLMVFHVSSIHCMWLSSADEISWVSCTMQGASSSPNVDANDEIISLILIEDPSDPADGLFEYEVPAENAIQLFTIQDSEAEDGSVYPVELIVRLTYYDQVAGANIETVAHVPFDITYRECAILGDLTGNGVADCADLALLEELMPNTPADEANCAANMNGDGTINNLDLMTFILSILNGEGCP